jgi:hypothetical protein
MLPIALSIISAVLSMSKKDKGKNVANMINSIGNLTDKVKPKKDLTSYLRTNDDEDEEETLL